MRYARFTPTSSAQDLQNKSFCDATKNQDGAHAVVFAGSFHAGFSNATSFNI